MGRITIALILINLILFETVFALPKDLRNNVFESYSLSKENSFEIWRWLTSLFLHVSASHLFFNMLGLYFFGRSLEKQIKALRFLSLYFVSGLLGNLAFISSSSASVVGASGCVFGLLGAAMLLNPAERISLYILPLPLGIIAILFGLTELAMLYFQPPEFSHIANIAHLAGMVSGCIFAFFYDFKQSLKGILGLFVCASILIVFWQLFGLITVFGSFVLKICDVVIGALLYSIANLIGKFFF